MVSSSRLRSIGQLALLVSWGCGPGFLGEMDSGDDTAHGSTSTAPASTSEDAAASSTTNETSSSTGIADRDDDTGSASGYDASAESAGSTEDSEPGAASSESTTGDDACADLVAGASSTDLARTPYPDAEAELLAFESRGTVVAPEDAYLRIQAELAAIRTEYPEMAEIVAQPSWDVNRLDFRFDEDGARALVEGTYDAWDCLNAHYGVTRIDLSRTEAVGTASIHFPARLNIEALILDYMDLPSLVIASAMSRLGDGNDVCVLAQGDAHLYIFDRGSGDCPAGCIRHAYQGFMVGPDLAIEELGTFERSSGSTDEVPAWFAEAEACTAFLL